ncbi:MAG: ribonuclease D, partial [Acidobacteriota bacterium]|nr:ribonuclease D [Acidobacteriota bacterium]
MDVIAGPVNGAGLEQTGRDPGEKITTRARLEEVVESAQRQPRVAVDLESNNFHRYPDRVCLVQLATSHAVYLVDPLSIEDMAPLGELLANAAVEKVFHSANSDLRLLDRDWNFPVRGLFDTSIGAAFVGSEKLGLAAVLTEYLGIEIDK